MNPIKALKTRLDYLHSVMSTGVAAVLGFINFALLARLLSQQEFGHWMVFLTGATFLDMIRTGLVHTGFVRHTSGASEEHRRSLEGAGLTLGIGLSLALSLLIWLPGMAAPGLLTGSSFELFFRWYPVWVVVTFPRTFAVWVLQARRRFDRVLYLRTALNGSVTVMLGILYGFDALTLEHVMWGVLTLHGLTSLICWLIGWVRFTTLRVTHKDSLKTLFHFGKYSFGTLMASNLLRSSDTFILGWLLGPAAVALYNVPQKLIEIIEIPLRGLVAAAFPEMSQKSAHHDHQGIQSLLIKSVSWLVGGLLPVVLLYVWFAEPLVYLVGGQGYGEAALILKIFAAYALMLPLDRYAGVALDSMNKPHYNFLKVAVMASINIAGDIIAIMVFRTVWAVALVTIITFFVGLVLSVSLLWREFRYTATDLSLHRHSGVIP